MSEIEKVRMLKTLKVGTATYLAGEVISKPIPPDLLKELDRNTGTVEQVAVPVKPVAPAPPPPEEKVEVEEQKPIVPEEQAEPEEKEAPHKKIYGRSTSKKG